MGLKKQQVSEIEETIIDAFKRPKFQKAIMASLVAVLENSLKDYTKSMADLEAKNKQLTTTCAALQETVLQQSKQIEHLDNLSRRKYLRIFCIQKSTTENTRELIKKKREQY